MANSRPLPDPPRPAATLADRAEIGDLLVTGSGKRLSQNAQCHRSLKIALHRRERDTLRLRSQGIIATLRRVLVMVTSIRGFVEAGR